MRLAILPNETMVAARAIPRPEDGEAMSRPEDGEAECGLLLICVAG
jgi:hypothetical protein